MNIRIHPAKILMFLFLTTAFLLIINLAGIFTRIYTDNSYLEQFTLLFDFDYERNIPSFFSTILLFTSALLLLTLTMSIKERGEHFYWMGLTAIFFFLTIDEFASIHEELIPIVRNSLGTSGYLHFAWVIPYGVGVLVIGAIYLRHLLRLPAAVRNLLVISAILYVGGALGFEMLGAKLADHSGIKTLSYAMLYTIEESLEMLGISVFIFALLKYLDVQNEAISLMIGKTQPSQWRGEVVSGLMENTER